MEPSDISSEPSTESQAYGRAIIASLGSSAQYMVPQWRRGMTGTAPGGIRFVFYGGHIRASGSPAWRTNNPGKVFINAVSRSNGAIGNDGRYAIFPDAATARHALSALLRTPGYSRVPVRQILQDFAWTPRHEARIQVIAGRVSVESATALGDLDSESTDRLVMAICAGDIVPPNRVEQTGSPSKEIIINSGGFTDSFSSKIPADQVGNIYFPGSVRNPRWVQRVFATASPADEAEAARLAPANPADTVYLGWANNWQQGVWYQRQPDGTYAVSPSQDPQHDGSVGDFARYYGQNSWDLYASGGDDQTTQNPIPPLGRRRKLLLKRYLHQS